MALRQQLREYRDILSRWALLRWMLVSGFLIAVNWLIYVWAVNNGHILAASFGYYLNPLMNIMVGTMLLGERLNKRQYMAVAIAVLGVAVMAVGQLDTLWISLSLAASFCAYGIVRKMAPVGAVPGLAVETTLMLPLAMAGAFWFVSTGPHSGWGYDSFTTGMLAAGGAVTAIPLLLFAVAARRLDYSLMGFIQYLAPTLQFFVGFTLYNEGLSATKLVSFIIIWVALSIFSWDAFQRMREN